MPPTLIFQIIELIDYKTLNTQASKNKKNKNIPDVAGKVNSDSVNENIKNLLIVAKLAKSKKSNLIKPKKLDLIKAKKLNFAKANSLKIDFLTLEAKEAFIYL